MHFRILLNGYKGRMGQAIRTAVEDDSLVTIASQLEDGDAITDAAFDNIDVAIDFSSHDATLALVQAAARRRVPLVIGTTGHSDAERAAILPFTVQIPIVWSGNYSLGVNPFNYLVKCAAKVLTSSYDVEILEMHHRHKADAPSGTAGKLIEIIREARAISEDQVVYGRNGLIGPRPEFEIGVHSIRGGDVVGDHTVIFAGEGERIELTHRASQRAIFATGALRAAKWVVYKKIPSGLYGMDDVLGLKD
jgi:4-hydroxy-tetrahydrodipicolinate reductase